MFESKKTYLVEVVLQIKLLMSNQEVSASSSFQTHHRLWSSLNCQDLISDGELDTLHFSFIVHSVEETWSIDNVIGRHRQSVRSSRQWGLKLSSQIHKVDADADVRYFCTGSGTWRQHCSCRPGLWPPPLWRHLNAPQTPAARKQDVKKMRKPTVALWWSIMINKSLIIN